MGDTFDERFTRFLKAHPHAPSYKATFARDLKANVPGTRKEQGLVTVAWKAGVAEEIGNSQRLTTSFAYQLSRKVSSMMRVSRDAAEWAVAQWCVCYGERTLHKACDVKLTELRDGSTDLTTTQVGVETGAANEKLFKVQMRNGMRVITAYTGDDDVPTLVVPGSIGGMPARRIAPEVFAGSMYVHVILRQGIQDIGAGAFKRCRHLQQAVLPDGLRVIGADAFRGCLNLRRVAIPGSVEEIGEGAFADTGLEGIVIPDSVRKIGGFAFENCNHLIDADVGSGIAVLPEYMFCGCHALEEVDLPGTIERIEAGAFEGCTVLQDLAIPDSTKFIGENAFAHVSGSFRLVGRRGSVVDYYARTHGVRAFLTS